MSKDKYESLKTISESHERESLGNEDRWRTLERDLAREIEANSLFARKMQSIGRFLLGEEVPLASVETDEFYNRIDLESRILRADNQRYYLHLHKIGAIALGDGDFEESLGSITKEDVENILSAIATLRGALSDHMEARDAVMAENRNLLDSLILSQQEVADLQQQLKDAREVAKGHVKELTELRKEKIERISRASVIASRIRGEVSLLVNSSLPL